MPYLKKCRTCSREVSSEAKVCPQCGQDKPGEDYSWIFWLIVVLAVLGSCNG
jgi:RNA polymerase subunit RPABC4/transcription elongation factor Spt4